MGSTLAKVETGLDFSSIASIERTPPVAERAATTSALVRAGSAAATPTIATATSPVDVSYILSTAEAVVGSLLAPMASEASGISGATALPTDDIFVQFQWHLNQTVVGLYDLNVSETWDAGFNGTGIRVAVIDDGYDYTHSDFDNYRQDLDWDYADNDADAFGVDGNNHGTPVAGLIGAARDGTGSVGVAYGAEMVGYRLYGFISDRWLENVRDAIRDAVDVSDSDVINISQGMANSASTVMGAFLSQSKVGEVRSAIAYAVDDGRGGLGISITKAAGNSGTNGNVMNYDVNADMWTNDTRQIVVAAVDQDGTVSGYSSFGAAILVSGFGTPGDVVSTDRVGSAGANPSAPYADYRTFNGTSAAAPMVAGVVALMLDSNENLGWRDVQSILAMSSRHVGSSINGTTTDGIERTPWNWNHAESGNLWNGGAAHFSNSYGYGLVDATAAVRLSQSWLLNRSAQTSANQAKTVQDGLNSTVTIADGNTSGRTFNITETDKIRVERVALTVKFETTYIGDVEVYLTSPDGTRVELIRDILSGDASEAYENNFNGTWTFEAQAFRGELSSGTWKVKIVDDATGDVLKVSDIVLRTYGEKYDTNDRWVFTDEFSKFKNVAGHSTNLVDENGGYDTINAAALSSKVTVNLGSKTGTIDGVAVKVTNFENVIGGNTGDSLTGSSGVNELYGMAGDDTFRGGNGNDKLRGGLGNDVFRFDNSLSSSNIDSILDFKPGTDEIELKQSIFTGIGSELSSAEFYKSAGASSAHDSSDRIIYNTSNGRLYLDRDGAGGDRAIHFATLTTKPSSLSYSDFDMIG